MTFRAIILAACLGGLLSGCLDGSGPHKQALDALSTSQCLAQREVAIDGLTRWLDAQIGDGQDTVALVQTPFAIIIAEDAKPDDQEDDIALAIAEGAITGVVIKRLVDFGKMTYDDNADKNVAEIALQTFNDLPNLGFDLVAWRTLVSATPCS